MQTRRYVMKTHEVCKPYPIQTYTVAPRPRFVPRILWRLACWVWYKLAREYVHYESISSTEILNVNVEDLLHKIRLDQQNLDMIWNERCRHVILGYDQYRDLLDIADRRYGYISGIYDNMELINNGVHRAFGLEIHLVPWFDGVLLLPDMKWLHRE